MRFQKHENIKKISGKWKTWNMILKKTATGYLRTVTVYQCHECKGCPFKEKCIKGNYTGRRLICERKRRYEFSKVQNIIAIFLLNI